MGGQRGQGVKVIALWDSGKHHGILGHDGTQNVAVRSGEHYGKGAGHAGITGMLYAMWDNRGTPWVPQGHHHGSREFGVCPQDMVNSRIVKGGSGGYYGD